MSEPWSGTTKEALQEKARKLDLPTTGSREQLYHRIEQYLRQRVLELDTTDEEEALIEAAMVTTALAVVPDDDDTDAVMDAWRSGADVVEPVSTLPEMSRWAQMQAMAAVLSRSALMPAHIRNSRDKEADCLVMLLAAHDLGLTSTLAFQKINVIEGKPSLAADLMRVLIQRDGHDIKINVTKNNAGTAVSAEVLINRVEWRDDEWRGAEFTMMDASAAGLANKTNWKGFAEDMLVARATSRAARRYCSDSLGGISYTPEELGAIEVEEYTGPAAPPAPEPMLMTDEHLTQIDFAITVLEGTQRAWLAEQWKAKGIPPLHPKRADATPLTEEWVPTITALLAEARDQPSDAVVVEEQAGVLVTGHTKGRDHANTPDPTVDEKVDSLRESVDDVDAALADSKTARAAIARRVLEEAKARAEAAGVIDALCPDCGKPMKEDNPSCKTHPL